MSLIEIKDLKKNFVINKRDPGMKGVIKNLFHSNKVVKEAVKGISFNIDKGEMVGFIGPNGAGKSTTIKMLTGILVPTAGTVMVNEIVPYKNRKENAMRMGVVFGQRTQLWWTLPVRESLDLLRTIYQIPMERFNKNINTFIEILEIGRFIDTPVRQLSLGQRMRVEIAASLIHNPDIVYLDEPTIGLDIVAKDRIREFIEVINREIGVTVILTTHDMSDIEKLCKRIIIIDNGVIIYDGDITQIKQLYGNERILNLDFEADPGEIGLSKAKIVKSEGARKQILFDKNEISAVDLIRLLSNEYAIKDFSLDDVKIDSIIKQIYCNNSLLKNKIEV